MLKMKTKPPLNDAAPLPRGQLDVESPPLASGVAAALKLITFPTMRRSRIDQCQSWLNSP